MNGQKTNNRNLVENLGLNSASEEAYDQFLIDRFKKIVLDNDFDKNFKKSAKQAEDWCKKYKVGVEVFTDQENDDLKDNWIYQSRQRALLCDFYKIPDFEKFQEKYKIFNVDKDKIRKDREEEYKKLVKYSGIHDQFQETRFQAYQCKTESQEKVLEVCREFAHNFKRKDNDNPFFIMLGKPGTGKTMLASIVLKQVIWKTMSQSRYINYTNFMQKVYDRITSKQTTEHEAFFRYQICPLLVIDEIGYDNSDFAMNQLFRLIENRMTRGLTTLLISNKRADELKQIYNSRGFQNIMSRIFQKNSIIQIFDWQDWRQ